MVPVRSDLTSPDVIIQLDGTNYPLTMDSVSILEVVVAPLWVLEGATLGDEEGFYIAFCRPTHLSSSLSVEASRILQSPPKIHVMMLRYQTVQLFSASRKKGWTSA